MFMPERDMEELKRAARDGHQKLMEIRESAAGAEGIAQDCTCPIGMDDGIPDHRDWYDDACPFHGKNGTMVVAGPVETSLLPLSPAGPPEGAANGRAYDYRKRTHNAEGQPPVCAECGTDAYVHWSSYHRWWRCWTCLGKNFEERKTDDKTNTTDELNPNEGAA